MKINEIMELDIENLAEEKLKALKGHTIQQLNSVIRLIENNDFELIEERTSFSPAGDGMGRDNYYVSFYNDMDIVEIAEKLQRLKEAAGI